jgi:hypothetical protein
MVRSPFNQRLLSDPTNHFSPVLASMSASYMKLYLIYRFIGSPFFQKVRNLLEFPDLVFIKAYI